MNRSELSMMQGMISILNEASKRPILSEEEYAERLMDLQQFEEETGFVYTNSPTCKDKIGSISVFDNVLRYDYRKCNNIDNIVEFANQREMLIYPNLIGNEVEIIYNDGIMANVVLSNNDINLKEVINIPYKINKQGIFAVKGVLHNQKFFVTNVVNGSINILNKKLEQAENLGFNIIPYWIATINPKKLQDSIDYVFNYANEEELSCDGIVFRFNNNLYSSDRIVYEVMK